MALIEVYVWSDNFKTISWNDPIFVAGAKNSGITLFE